MALARKFGAAVVALTIDEVGMARKPEDKLRIASRLVEFACNKYGLPQSDLMIDRSPLPSPPGRRTTASSASGRWRVFA